MECLQCQVETRNPKFCSRSCSTTYANAQKPKRLKLEYFCAGCQVSMGRPGWKDRRKYCISCKPGYRARGLEWERTTKADLAPGTANQFGYPQIRQHARRVLSRQAPRECVLCLYSLHVDCCHVVPIRDYPDTATVAEMNAVDNLVFMCKNHHWEYDHEHLTRSDVLTARLLRWGW